MIKALGLAGTGLLLSASSVFAAADLTVGTLTTEGDITVGSRNISWDLPGGTTVLDFANGGSKIYNDADLHIDSDDYIKFYAPTWAEFSSDIKIMGDDLFFSGASKPTVDFNRGDSKIYDDNDLHVATDDTAYLDAPTQVLVNSSALTGLSDNTTDLGTEARSWNDAWFDGKVWIRGSIDVSTAAGLIIQDNSITDAKVVDTLTASNYLPLAGGTMTGAVNMGNNVISNIGNAGTDFAANGGLTLANALTVTTGGATITAGGLTVTAGGATITAGGLDMTNDAITNIGAAGTDFSATGGLTLADALTVTSGGLTVTAGGATITAGGLDMTNDAITNIGAAGTDFSTAGGLTLADDLTITGNDLAFGNGEAISNTTDGTIAFTDGTNTLATIVDSGTTGYLSTGAVVIGTSYEPDLQFTGTAVEIEVANTGTITFRDSATNTLMTVADAGTTGDVTVSGDLTVSGAINGSISGATGTTSNSFKIDSDQSADADVTLTFGNTSNETLIWDQSAAAFVTSDDLLASAADTNDLGSAAFEWRYLYLGDQNTALQFGQDQDMTVGFDTANTALEILGDAVSVGTYANAATATGAGDLLVADDLEVNGAANLDGALDVAGATTLNGAVTLGDATADDITVTGYVASHVLPKTADTYNLGSASNEWAIAYFGDNAASLQFGTGQDATIGIDTTNDALEILVDGTDVDLVSIGAYASEDHMTASDGDLLVAGEMEVNDQVWFDGAVNLGDATGDDVTVTGYIASNVISKTADSYNLGDTTHEWGIVYLGDNASALQFGTGQDVTIGIDTTNDGLEFLPDGADVDMIAIGPIANEDHMTPSTDGDLLVGGEMEVNGASWFDGAVTLGDATGDDITVTGYVASDVIPKTDNTYDLGSATAVWAVGFFTTVQGGTADPLTITATATADADDLTLQTTGAEGDVVVASADDITINGDSDAAHTISIANSGTGATTLNLVTTNLANTVNVATGTGIDTINIGTGGTAADDINIGDALADVDITGASQIVAGTGDSLTLTGNAASTWSTSAGALTLTSAAAATWSTADGILTLQGDDGVNIESDASGGIELDPFNNAVVPGGADGDDLGSTSAEWRALYLGDGATALKFSTAQDASIGTDLTADALEIVVDGTNVDFVSIGDSASEDHMTASDGDLLVTDELEVNGGVWFDGAVQANSTVTVGVDDTGYDVKLFGATTGKYWLWSESGDDMIVMGDALVGATSESIAHTSFAMDNNDLYVEDMLGVNGRAFFDGQVDVGQGAAGYQVNFWGDDVGESFSWYDTDGRAVITSTVADTNSVNVFDVQVTDNTSTSGDVIGLEVNINDGAASPVAASDIYAEDTTQALSIGQRIRAAANATITTGLQILAGTGGAVTTAIDVSDAEVGTALSFGANTISGTGTLTGGSILPSAVDTYDLGSTGAEWQNIFVGDTNTGIQFGQAQDVTVGWDDGNDALEILGDAVSVGTYANAATATEAGDLLVADALEVNGPVDFDGDTIDIDASAAGITAISLTTTNAAGGIDIDPGTGGIDVDLDDTGPFAIDGDLVVIGNAGLDGDVADGDNDLLVTGVIEVDGELEVDGTLDVNNSSTFDGAITATLAATEELNVDAVTTAHTSTGGVIDLDVGAGDAAVDGIDIALTQNNGVSAGVNAVGIDMTLTGNDADGDVFGIVISAADAANAGANTYEAAISIDNADTTAGSMPDAIIIASSGVSGGVVDAIDASAGNITNALNVGANTITGGAATIDFTNFDVTTAGEITVAAGTGLDTNGAGVLDLGVTNATSIEVGTDLLDDTAGTDDIGGTSNEWAALYLADNTGVNLGLDQDALLAYDEATDDRVELTGTGASLFIQDRLGLGKQSLTITDDGTANDALTPTASYVEATVDATGDATTPNLTIVESSAKEGDLLIIINDTGSNDSFTINDEAGVTNGSAQTLGVEDTSMFIYTGAIWLQLSAGNN